MCTFKILKSALLMHYNSEHFYMKNLPQKSMSYLYTIDVEVSLLNTIT